MIAHTRPIFLSFLGVALGIWLTEFVYIYNQSLWLILTVSILILIFLFGFLYYVFKKSKFLEYVKNIKWSILTILISVCVGVGLFYIDLSKQLNSVQKIEEYKIYSIIATVDSTPNINNEKIRFIVRDAIVTADETSLVLNNGIYISANIEGSSNNSEILNLKRGDVIMFSSYLFEANIYETDGINSYPLKSGFRYIASTNVENILITEIVDETLIQKIQNLIKDKLFDNMEFKNASIAYGIFLGDTAYIEDEVVTNFTISGVSHLLAVSGLNVAFIILLLIPILKLCRVGPKFSVIIVFLFLILYCFICDLSITVIRASLMAIVLLIGQLFGKQTDAINSTSLVGLFILLISPWQVFDLSFVLSFASVFGIIMLGPIFFDFFKKCKLGNFISSTLSVSLAAQLGTLPFIIQTFENLSTYSLIVNFIVIPILGYVYMAMFVALIISFIFPFMGFLLWLTQWGYWLLDVITTFVASISYAYIHIGTISDLIIVISLLMIFIFSRFCIIDKKLKVLLLSTSVMFLFLIIFKEFNLDIVTLQNFNIMLQ